MEQLCRYLLRPPVAQDRLRLTGDGRVLLTLKTAWADGTRHLVFEPLELLEKLAALTPRPRINLVLYHGVLAPHARWRAQVVGYGAPPAPEPSTSNPAEEDRLAEPGCAELVEKGAAFLGAGDSGKPVGLGELGPPGKRFLWFYFDGAPVLITWGHRGRATPS